MKSTSGSLNFSATSKICFCMVMNLDCQEKFGPTRYALPFKICGVHAGVRNQLRTYQGSLRFES